MAVWAKAAASNTLEILSLLICRIFNVQPEPGLCWLTGLGKG